MICKVTLVTFLGLGAEATELEDLAALWPAAGWGGAVGTSVGLGVGAGVLLGVGLGVGAGVWGREDGARRVA